jgi:hypothetical protein
MSTPLDADLVILNPGRNNYVGLDAIGRRVWEMLAAPSGVAALREGLAREYRGDPERMTGDLLNLLGELADEGLVRVVSG